MKLARPPGGFKISLAPNVDALVKQRCESDPEFDRHWQDIVARLSFVAHVEGVADSRLGNGCRLWAAAGDDERGLPRVRLVYLVLGDTVRIRLASIG